MLTPQVVKDRKTPKKLPFQLHLVPATPSNMKLKFFGGKFVECEKINVPFLLQKLHFPQFFSLIQYFTTERK